MNLNHDPEVFPARLAAWSVRGVGCAAPSFAWAMIIKFNDPIQLAAMLAGVATYVIAFAWATSLPAYCEHVEPGDLGWSFRLAANLRAVLAPLMFFNPDAWLGAASLALIKFLAGSVSMEHLEKEKSFGTIYAITVTQGALVSSTMFGLALVIWMVRAKCWKRWLGSRVTWALPPAA